MPAPVLSNDLPLAITVFRRPIVAVFFVACEEHVTDQWHGMRQFSQQCKAIVVVTLLLLLLNWSTGSLIRYFGR